MADSSLEWKENKAIIQRMRVCGKDRKGCDSFQEFRPISVMGHVHLRQEKSIRQNPQDPITLLLLIPQRHLSLDKVPLKTESGGDGEGVEGTGTSVSSPPWPGQGF